MIRILFWPINKLFGLVSKLVTKREYDKPE